MPKITTAYTRIYGDICQDRTLSAIVTQGHTT
jgi:hypothetical protein